MGTNIENFVITLINLVLISYIHIIYTFLAGSVFGGAALLLCVQAFLKFGRKQRQ